MIGAASVSLAIAVSLAGQQPAENARPLETGVAIAKIETNKVEKVDREVPAPPRQVRPAWTGVALGGLLANGGAGIAVGGGARGEGVFGNEKFGLMFDGLWSNANFCSACDNPFFDLVDYSGSSLSFSGAFLYLFKESSGGWRPYAGGGIVFVRWTISVESTVLPIGVSDSGTTGGIQVQGGVSRRKLILEFRAQSAAGGGAAALVGYRFGGSQ